MKTIRRLIRDRRQYSHGGNVRNWPLDNRTYDQRREDEIRAIIYIMNQSNTYLY